MKLAKLSLAALMALGVSAFADVQNIKVSGDAKLFYGTADVDYDENYNKIKDSSLFGKSTSYGQAAFDLAATADLADGVKGKVGITALSTLGLENNLVSDIWAGGTTQTTWWASEAWLAKTFGNTTVKVGRQYLDTPLAFSEKWNIAANSFDAAVVLNNDLPQTTLVAAWIGRGNGAGDYSVVRTVTNGGDSFRTYGSAIQDTLQGKFPGKNVKVAGAYAVAAVTKAIPYTTAQVWYYDVVDIASAWWLQADIDLKEVLPGLTFGAQYADINPASKLEKELSTKLDDAKAWAVKLGYSMDNLKLAAAYSATDKKGPVLVANTATGLKGSQSKLYTEAWWNYGYVSAPDTKTWMVSADYNMEGIADFMAQYTSANQGTTGGDVDMQEFTLAASKSFGNLDTTLAYIYTKADDQNQKSATDKGDGYNMIQVYLTYNF